MSMRTIPGRLDDGGVGTLTAQADQQGHHHQLSFALQVVDQYVSRHLSGLCSETHGRHGDPNTHRIPMQGGDKVNGHKEFDSGAYVSQEMIKTIQGQAPFFADWVRR